MLRGSRRDAAAGAALGSGAGAAQKKGGGRDGNGMIAIVKGMVMVIRDGNGNGMTVMEW